VSVSAGDGCFLMNGQEFATAVPARPAEHRVHRRQQRHVRHDPHASGARVSGPCIGYGADRTPTSRRYARAYRRPRRDGGKRTADFAPAFERALAASGKPAIIHVKTDAEAITSRITMSKLREQALAKQKQ
jgi:acetolactate synthase-1/2/3 large subunit